MWAHNCILPCWQEQEWYKTRDTLSLFDKMAIKCSALSLETFCQFGFNSWGILLFYQMLSAPVCVKEIRLALDQFIIWFVKNFPYLSCLMRKTTKWHVRPAKTQVSLGIRPVWSESSLSAWRKLGSLVTHGAHSENSDQIGQMPRLIWVFFGCTVILLVLSWGSSFVKNFSYF